MQTFLTFHEPVITPNTSTHPYVLTAWALDYRRLGKQRVEAKQILLALEGQSRGWVNHPATRMWRDYTSSLVYYGRVMCEEWIRRGYNDNLLPFFNERLCYGSGDYIPKWLTEEFVTAHRSNLIRKDEAFYAPLFPDTPRDLEYVWPV